MNKDPQIFLKHILESIAWIEKDIEEMSKDDFLKNVPIQDAVVRRIEIIGEAIRYLPPEVKKESSDVPWQDIMDMRNKIIHEYFGVDLELVWEVVQKDIPELKGKVEEILSSF